MRALNQVERQVLALLQDYKSSLNLKQIGEQLVGIADHDLKVALDTLVLRDLVERIDTGRQVIFVALAPAAPTSTTPAAPTAAAVPEPAAVQVPHTVAAMPLAIHKVSTTAHVHAELRDRVLQLVAESEEDGAKSQEVAQALMQDQEAIKTKLKSLRDKGLLCVRGKALSARWFLTDAGRAHLGIKPLAATTEFTPGLANPAVQPIDTATSTAASAVCTTLATVTEPAGPRDGLSSFEHAGDFEPAADELLAWHQQRAEQEAERRQPAFALPNAMRNTGDDGVADLAVAGCVLIDTASFALWSDGRLEIDAGSDHVTLSQPATRALLDYLDRVCAIEQH